MEDRLARSQTFHQGQPFEHVVFDMRDFEVDLLLVVDQFLVGDKLRQHHGGGLQRLDLDLFVAARVDMLDAQHTHGAFPVDDRHTGEGMEFLLARFGAIGEIGVRLGLCQVQRLDILRDRAGEAFADRKARDVDGFGIEALRGIKFESAFTKQVNRTDLA